MLRVKRALGSTYGPQPKMMKWAYTAIIRPKLSYGCHLWLQNTRYKNTITQLNTIQRYALLAMGPVHDHTPTAGMEIISKTQSHWTYTLRKLPSTHKGEYWPVQTKTGKAELDTTKAT